MDFKYKFIDNFEITIGSSNWDRKNPMLVFILNERFVTVPLKEFKKWIDTIVESNGDRNPKAYEAFNNFKSVFSELLFPFINHAKEDTSNE